MSVLFQLEKKIQQSWCVVAVENSIEFGVGAKVSMEAQTFSRVAPLGLDKKGQHIDRLHEEKLLGCSGRKLKLDKGYAMTRIEIMAAAYTVSGEKAETGRQLPDYMCERRGWKYQRMKQKSGT